MTKEKIFKFDPRDLISPPFKICPKCKEKLFGVLSIYGNSYSRRCKNCLYPVGTEKTADYYLPKIKKKVIYLDQFAISEMMKVLNPNSKAHRKGTINKIWLDVFEKIHKLCKMQLMICPDSNYHHDESIVSPFFNELKRIYELFSHAITFNDSNSIQNQQLFDHAECWLKGNEYNPIFEVNEITDKNINTWQDRLIVTVDFGNTEYFANEIRQSRETVHDNFKRLFEFWKKEKGKTFKEFYNRESKNYGRTIFESYLSYLQKWQDPEDVAEQDLEELMFPPNNVIIIQQLQILFEEYGIIKSNLIEKIGEYLCSPIFDEIPFINISALLIAGLARRATSGQKKPPNQGMANDIFLVATFAPYVDAMFIDNSCYSLLNENPIKKLLSEYNTGFFCQNNLGDFLEYLDEIENSTSDAHLSILNDVYGEQWLKPYLEVFRH